MAQIVQIVCTGMIRQMHGWILHPPTHLLRLSRGLSMDVAQAIHFGDVQDMAKPVGEHTPQRDCPTK